jgi:hypothetical protein
LKKVSHWSFSEALKNKFSSLDTFFNDCINHLLIIFRNSSERYERSDRSMSYEFPSLFLIKSFISKDAPQSTPPVVQLSPTPPIPVTSELTDKGSVTLSTETETTTPVQAASPVCVILDDDSSPTPSIDKKVVRRTPTTPVKRSNDNEKNSSKPNKRSRDSDKSYPKDKTNESSEIKRKRLNDGTQFLLSDQNKKTNKFFIFQVIQER